MRHHGGRIGAQDAGLLQRLARQIEPPDRRILVDVAQDVGELQRAAEMMGEAMPAFSSMPNTRTRQPPDRARDAVAIGIERRPVRRADVRTHVHLHAVDHGLEILAPQARIPSPP